MPYAAALLDLASRKFWRGVGQPIDLDGRHAWLTAPTVGAGPVGDSWLTNAAERIGGSVGSSGPTSGLLPDMAALDGPGFRASELHPLVRHFYEHTAAWRMEVWTEWNPVFAPGGAAVSRFFGRRVQQLAIPTKALAVSRGMDSKVVPILDSHGHQAAAGWIRTLRSTGEFVYSGCYTSQQLPGADRPSVHVSFPLESGNVQVFLRPSALADGSLELRSPRGRFGADGAYVTVRDSGADHAARVPLHELFRVFVDDEGVLRTDHLLTVWSAPAIRLHYKLTRAD